MELEDRLGSTDVHVKVRVLSGARAPARFWKTHLALEKVQCSSFLHAAACLLKRVVHDVKRVLPFAC